jgi:hypothetical protein
MRFLDVWITDDEGDKHFFKLLLGQEAEGEDPYKVVGITRDSLSEHLGGLSCVGTSFEEVLLKLAAHWAAAADALRAFAGRAQATMNAGDATMTPFERTTSDQIRQYLVERAHGVEAGPERERIFDLAIRVSRGEWKHGE